MSLTLGEKLRQAREERGFTLSEVAEQTRISSQYLQSIEHDDYRILPGGIFNKGFVKSFAKFVGVNEQEALADYTSQIAESEIAKTDDPKPYRPEVLTDDRSYGSMMPTMIIAAIILALMTIGILYGLSYLREPTNPSVATNTTKPNTNAATGTPDVNPDAPPSNVPEMASLKVEFKAVTSAVSLSATTDGRVSYKTLNAGSTEIFEPKESLKLGYSRSLASAVQMTINGKTITLPAVPLVPKRNAIEFEINKDNLAQIWTDGAISTSVPSATPPQNANLAAVPINPTPPPTTPTQPAPRPTATRAVATPTPRANPTGRVRTVATPKPVVITVPSANRP